MASELTRTGKIGSPEPLIWFSRRCFFLPQVYQRERISEQHQHRGSPSQNKVGFFCRSYSLPCNHVHGNQSQDLHFSSLFIHFERIWNTRWSLSSYEFYNKKAHIENTSRRIFFCPPEEGKSNWQPFIAKAVCRMATYFLVYSMSQTYEHDQLMCKHQLWTN